MSSRDDNKFAYSFYCSRPWRRCREGYLKSKGYLCERCYSVGLYTPATEVHHKQKLTPENINDPSVSLNWDNLECLCFKCHHEEHDTDGRCNKPGRRRWKLSADGVVQLPEVGGGVS